MIYWNTKEYMSDRLVRPVIKRAESFKELGNAVLDSKVSNFAADRLDDFVDAADKYVERYLPEPNEDEVDYGEWTYLFIKLNWFYFPGARDRERKRVRGDGLNSGALLSEGHLDYQATRFEAKFQSFRLISEMLQWMKTKTTRTDRATKSM